MEVKVLLGIELADKAMTAIAKEWQADVLPKAFYGAVGIPEQSWDLLVKRMYSRVFAGLLHGHAENFVIAFLGSSVTAGHDNNFNTSTTEVLREFLTPVIDGASLGFNVVVRNLALGGMGCFPYDVCANTFAGIDVDILQWEQTYFCFEGNARRIAEGMIRQVLSTPGAPLVAFADSATGHWGKDVCVEGSKEYKDKRIDLKDWNVKHRDESTFKGKSAKELATKVNLKEVSDRWGWVKNELLPYYPQAGIHFFSHTVHDGFKCMGPYTPTFNEGAASWHPSVKAHRLRASRYAYFWIGAFKEALGLVLDDLKVLVTAFTKEDDEMKKSISDIHKKIHDSMRHHQGHELGDAQPAKFYESNHPLQCYSNFLPRHNTAMTMSAIRVHTPQNPENDKWRLMIEELLLDKNIIEKAQSRGYLDFKVSYIGNNVEPISFAIQVKRKGKVSICEAPLIWGKPPPTCETIQKEMPNVYITEKEPKKVHGSNEEFFKSLSNETPLKLEKFEDTCLRSTEEIMPGNYVLSIRPLSEKNIVLGFILVP